MTVVELVGADAAADPTLANEWRLLAEQQGSAFLTPEWFSAWNRHYAVGVASFVVVVRDRSGLVGLLPLARSGRSVRFAGSNLGDRFGPLARPGRELDVAAAAATELGRHRLSFVWDNVDARSDWVATWRRSSPRRLTSTRLRSSVLPYVPIAGETWDSYLGARSRNFRSQIRRKERALRGEYGATFRRAAEPDRIAADVKSFFALHHARWSDRDGGSTIAADRVHAFHADFAAAALERGWLRLWFLEAGGRAVAAWYGWRVGDRYAYYQAGFDPRWAATSVGLVLMAHTVRSAIEEGAAEYDLLLGDESYKDRFATAAREVETLVLAGPLTPARLMAGVDVGIRAAAGRLSPELRGKVKASAGGLLAAMPGNRAR